MNIHTYWTIEDDEKYKVVYDNDDKITYEFSDLGVKIVALGYGD